MEKKILTKVVVAGFACVAICGAALARPHGGFGGRHHGGPGPGFHHMGPRHGFGPSFHHHHHHSFWGRGGRHFWPGFVGGVVGGAIYNACAPSTVVVSSPAVVTTPVVTTPVVTTPVVTTPVVTAPVSTVQNVWVEGRYVDQVQANGVVVRVWQPGHYEQRTVLVQ